MFRLEVLGFRVEGLEFRIYCLVLRLEVLGFSLECAWPRVQKFGSFRLRKLWVVKAWNPKP